MASTRPALLTETNTDITTNGAGGITGAILNTLLTDIINSAAIQLTDFGTNVFTALGVAVNAANGLLRLNGSGVVPQANLTAPAANAVNVASPTAPASTSTYAMQGLAGSITPATTGVVVVTISGTIIALVATTVNNGIKYQISYGTGGAPGTNATLTGTQIGPIQEYTSAVAPTAVGDVHVPFSISYVISGLSVGTAYWIDLAAESVTTASQMGLSAVSVVASEQ